MCRRSGFLAQICAKPQQLKCERKDTAGCWLCHLGCEEGEAPAGEAHLFTPEPLTLCVSVHTCVSVNFCVCVDPSPTGAETQK